MIIDTNFFDFITYSWHFYDILIKMLETQKIERQMWFLKFFFFDKKLYQLYQYQCEKLAITVYWFFCIRECDQFKFWTSHLVDITGELL